MRDEVRILKQFCKGIGVYGSDAKNLGISGYICELLVIKYGTFENVLKAVSKMEAGEIIDIENHLDSMKKEEMEKHIKKLFRNQPLIVIDPVDSERNVAAVLSSENFIKLAKKSREFIKRPAKNFFYPESRPLNAKEFKMLQERKTKFFSVSFQKPDVIDDIIYPQIRKTVERISTLLIHSEFEILRKFSFVDEKTGRAFLIFELECWELPLISSMKGPPVVDTKNSRNFLKKYSNPLFGPFVEDNKWTIDKKRNFKTADMAVKDFLKKSPKKLHESGIPEHISKAIFKSRIIQHDEFWKMARDNKNFSSFMREKYFEPM